MNVRHLCLIILVLSTVLISYHINTYAARESAEGTILAAATLSNDVFDPSSAGQWNRVSTPTTANLSAIIGGASFSFAVGANGTLLHYDGFEWTLVPTPTTVPLYGIWGASASDVFIVGAAGHILQLGDDGISRMPYVTSANLNAVWGRSPTDVFAVGDNGTILHFDGDVWSRQTHVTSSRLRGVGASRHGEVFAVGENGTIVSYNDDQWRLMETPTTLRLTAVWVFDSGEAIAVGAAGTVLRYDGEEWHLVQTPTTANLNGVWGISTTQVYAVGDNGSIIEFDGDRWTLTRANTSSRLTAIHNGVAVGDAGFVFQNATLFLEAANLRITELDPWSSQVEVTNFGPPFTTGELPMCHRMNCSSSIPLGTVFGAGGIHVFSVPNMDRTDTDLWLYRMMPFSDPNNLIHGAKYGSQPGVGHTDVAVSAGKWPSESSFAPAPFYGASLAFDGYGWDPKDWYVDETPSFGRPDYTDPGTVARSLYFPGGKQDFEEVLLGDEVFAVVDWEIIDQSAVQGMFTARVVDDVLGVVGSESGSTRWLRIRDQNDADEQNDVVSPMIAATEQTDYEWAFWVTIEEAAGGTGAYPAIMIQHASTQTDDVRATWGVEFRGDDWFLVVTESGGAAAETRLDMPLPQPWRWFFVQIVTGLENESVQVLVDGQLAGELPTQIDFDLDTRFYRLAYRGGGQGNTGTLLIDDVSVRALPFAIPLFTTVMVEAAAGNAVLSWGVRNDQTIDGFAVYRSTEADTEELIAGSLPPATRVYEDTGVDAGKTYRYVVEAVKSDATTERSRAVSVSIDSEPAVIFGDVRSRVELHTVALTWDVRLNEPIDGFRVYRRSGSTTEEIDITSNSLLPQESRSFDDRTVSPGAWYAYRIVAITAKGVEIQSPYSSVQVPKPPIEISPVFPNPFRDSTSLEFSIAGTERVTVSIYDVRGKLVSVLDDRVRGPGPHAVAWNGRDDNGHQVSAGTYFFKLEMGEIVSTRKVVLIR
ncbi:MAG: T9SS type A sorting domain-containing protein [Candidatus Latescibacterota bacterium]|nr:MAG: T9SS type A sorting domain-containing protein [Candidatus Latescibacterota bacterium]